MNSIDFNGTTLTRTTPAAPGPWRDATTGLPVPASGIDLSLQEPDHADHRQRRANDFVDQQLARVMGKRS